MSNFNIGDRVIFLNEKGGGIVTKVVDKNIVHVSVEDGFEIPYAVKDLLKFGGGDIDSIRSEAQQKELNPGLMPLYTIPNKPDQLAEGVYFACVPEDQKSLLSGKLKVCLINNSPYQLLYSMYQNRSGTFFGYDFGYVDPASLQLLASIERNQIDDWINGLVQLVFYMEGETTILHPASVTISFKPVRLYKEESFLYEPLIRNKAMILPLATIEQQAQKLEVRLDSDIIDHLKDYPDHKIKERRLTTRKESFLDKHKVDDKIAEVDLHIGELTDHFSGLSNRQILDIQMEYLRKCMEEARKEKLVKIIFIHGIGNGTLKNELSRFLRQSEGIDFYDAPYARYGLGATEVMFYRYA